MRKQVRDLGEDHLSERACVHWDCASAAASDIRGGRVRRFACSTRLLERLLPFSLVLGAAEWSFLPRRRRGCRSPRTCLTDRRKKMSCGMPPPRRGPSSTSHTQRITSGGKKMSSRITSSPLAYERKQ